MLCLGLTSCLLVCLWIRLPLWLEWKSWATWSCLASACLFALVIARCVSCLLADPCHPRVWEVEERFDNCSWRELQERGKFGTLWFWLDYGTFAAKTVPLQVQSHDRVPGTVMTSPLQESWSTLDCCQNLILHTYKTHWLAPATSIQVWMFLSVSTLRLPRVMLAYLV